MASADLEVQLSHERYPRARSYDPDWVIENQMGPHALWLLEALTQVLPIEAGMKVLDLGCGKAMTSIFLAREFGAEVWATDLWIPAEENLARIREAGVQDQVVPIHAEAHSLPFSPGFFDAVVSIDAYQYFGTADLYLGYITHFLRPGGRLGVVAPALFDEFGENVPEVLAPFWDWEFCCWHGPDWWRTHWAKTGKVQVEVADAIPDGWRDWLRFEEAIAPFQSGWLKDAGENTAAMLRADQGKLLGFTRIVGARA